MGGVGGLLGSYSLLLDKSQSLNIRISALEFVQKTDIVARDVPIQHFELPIRYRYLFVLPIRYRYLPIPAYLSMY